MVVKTVFIRALYDNGLVGLPVVFIGTGSDQREHYQDYDYQYQHGCRSEDNPVASAFFYRLVIAQVLLVAWIILGFGFLFWPRLAFRGVIHAF